MGFFQVRNLMSALLGSVLLLGTPEAGMARTVIPDTAEDFFGDDLSWLLSPDLLGPQTGRSDPAVLEILSRLMATDDERAGLALQNYLKRYPNDPAAYDLAGVYLMDQGEFENAINSFNKALVLAPGNDWLRAKLGIALLRRERFEAAKVQLDRAIGKNANNPLALRGLARLAMRGGDVPTAIQHSERALRAFGLPRNTVNQAHFDLADAYRLAGRHIAILDLLRPAVMSPDLDIPIGPRTELFGRFHDAAMILSRAEDARLAFDRLETLVDSNHPSVALTRARLIRIEGDTAGALAELDGIVAAHPQLEPQVDPDRAVTLSVAGRYDEAADLWWAIAQRHSAGDDAKFYQAALQARIDGDMADAAIKGALDLAAGAPDRADLQLLAIEMLGKGGDSDRALEMAKAMTASFPDDPEAHMMLGVLASAKGDTAAGVAALERSIALRPDNPTVWLTLAGTIHGHGSYIGVGHGGDGVGGHDEVEALLKNAIEANPTASDLYAELGLMYLSDGRVDDAIPLFDQAILHNPAHMAGLSLGAIARADAETDLGAALALIDRARAMAPDEPINKDILGWVMVRQGAVLDGMAFLEDAAAGAPDDVTIQYHLGVGYQALDQADRARTHLLASLGGPNYNHNVTDTRARYLALSPAESVKVEVARIDDGFEGEALGTITLSATDAGVMLQGDLTGLAAGPYASHIHEYANCAPGPDGPGDFAGGHYGHHAHHGHGASGPGDPHAGHDMSAMAETVEVAAPKDDAADAVMPLPAGDLESFVFDESGASTTAFENTRLTLDEVRGRSIMLHVGADVDVKSGPKIACGVIP